MLKALFCYFILNLVAAPTFSTCGIRVGMTREEVQVVLGKDTAYSEIHVGPQTAPSFGYYPEYDLAVTYSFDGVVAAVRVVEGSRK